MSRQIASVRMIAAALLAVLAPSADAVDPLLVQQAYLKASNPNDRDQYSGAVAISGDTVAVAATFESSAAAGVNGSQADNSTLAAGAVYVYVRREGVWMQQAYIKASNPELGDLFGSAVALDGDTLAVGALGEDSNALGANGNQANNGASNSGAVYVFVRNNGAWTQQAYLKASNPGPADEFGVSVSISGDTIAVGAPGEKSAATTVNGNQSDDSLIQAGAAYIFTRSGTVWAQQAYLKPSNTGAFDGFGWSIGVSGDTTVVGATFEDGVPGNPGSNAEIDSGAVYVFVRNGATWSQQAYLKAAQGDPGDNFGRTIGIDGETVIAGAYNESSNATTVNGSQTNNSSSRSGAAYVFVRNGSAWSQQAFLKASNANSEDLFGGSVDVSGDTALVGAYWEDSNATGVNGNGANNGVENSGAAYVFARSGTTWSQQSYLKASNPGASDLFGIYSAIDNGAIVVGARDEDSLDSDPYAGQSDDSGVQAGAAYVFGAPFALASRRVYKIHGGSGARLSVDPNSDLVTSQTFSSTSSRRFVFVQEPNSSFRIRSSGTKRFLRQNGVNLETTTISGQEDRKQFFLTPLTSGGYGLKVAANNDDWVHNPASTPLVMTQSSGSLPFTRFYIDRLFFDDVTGSGTFSEAANRLAGRAVTDGCSGEPLLYCPGDPTTRGQMAVFIIRALFGGDDFSFNTSPFFADVSASHPFFKWIQKMKELGITDGCAASLYCPDGSVTRGQMAVFIIRARYGTATMFPFNSSAEFADVPTNHPFFKWIQRMRFDGVTSGCLSGPLRYCPDDVVTRGQMAVFIMRGLFNELAPGDVPQIVSISPTVLVGSSSLPESFSITVANFNLSGGALTVTGIDGYQVNSTQVFAPSTVLVNGSWPGGGAPGVRRVLLTVGGAMVAHPTGLRVGPE